MTNDKQEPTTYDDSFGANTAGYISAKIARISVQTQVFPIRTIRPAKIICRNISTAFGSIVVLLTRPEIWPDASWHNSLVAGPEAV
jgi:hypothetical protein